MNENQYDEFACLKKIDQYENHLASFKDSINFLIKGYEDDIRSHIIALENEVTDLAERMERLEKESHVD
jgi:hypothetical protein